LFRLMGSVGRECWRRNVMRDILESIPIWLYLVLVAASVPLGCLTGGSAVTPFALAAIPTCAAALSGQRTTAMVTAFAACVVSLAGWWFCVGRIGGEACWLTPAIGVASLLAIAGMILAVMEKLDGAIAQLHKQTTQYVRALYERDKREEQQTQQCVASEPRSGPRAVRGELSQRETINFAMLLLTLQDVAQRISTNLDLETLVPTILDTARSSLKCQSCQLYFWNPDSKTLRRADPGKCRDNRCYVPQPTKGAARWVIENRQILTRQSVERDYNLRSILQEDPSMPDALAPLTVGGELLGLLVVDEVEDSSLTFVRMLYILSHNCALGIKNAQLFKRIEDMARRDGLTGLLNHASFREELDGLVKQAEADGSPLTVIMSDVDHFKKFNDTYGHQAGDHVLREVARLWQAVMPDGAVLGRYGGEEFVCALPSSDLDRARELAETLRQHLADQALVFEGRELRVTASFGVAERTKEVASSRDLVRVADEALYEAKQQGRNRVVCYVPEPVAVTSEQALPL
ncbi:MAG TPA: sensor domain-containing diguanylate cyclase, partial [Planctomycetaceae bacterium]|nr:sensor domain-containing diguanylate cyclase [Planctomycetaceae bacterium]